MNQTVLLGDIIDTIIDYRGKTPNKLGSAWSHIGYRVLSAKNIENGKIKNKDSIRFVDENLYKKWMKEEVQNGDILLTSEAPLGQSLLWDSDEKIALSQRLFAIRGKKELVDSNFLYAYITSPIFQHELQTRATGSTVKGIRQSELVKTRLNLPSLDKQKRIGYFIHAIDKKIELNRKINETLEQMGQALFKHYFIDNPEAEKWEKSQIKDIGTIITGKTPPKSRNEFFGGDYLFLKIPDMHNKLLITSTEDALTDAGVAYQSKKTIPRDSIAVSCIATVGLVTLITKDTQTNQQINSIIPKDRNLRFYNYFLLRTMSDELLNMASGGSATHNLNKGHFEKIKVLLPPKNLLDEFDNTIKPVIRAMEKNLLEAELLSALRDSLLPRLISGKVKI